MENIEQTTDYSIFKFLEGNRPLDKSHLRKLKLSIEKNNHLNLHPIIVNQSYEIIDGQHRLQVAKELNFPIFFIRSLEISDDHLIHCNVNQKLFEVENYIDFFAIKEKNPEYILLKSMLKSSGLKPKALLTLLLGIVNTSLLEFLKTGKFKFPKDQEPLEILDLYYDFSAYVRDKRIKPPSMFTNFNFTKSLRWLYKTSGFSKELLFKKLDNRWFDLKPQRTAEEWYQLLISIYNFKNHSKLDGEYGNAGQ